MREVPNLPKFAGGLAPFRGWPSFQEESLDGVAFFSDSTTVPPPQLLEGHATQVTELKDKCIFSAEAHLFQDDWRCYCT